MACLQTRNMKWNLIVIKKKQGFIYDDHVAGIFLSEKKPERDGVHIMASAVYSSYFKLHVRWLRSVTRITYLSKLIGIPSLAAFLKLELFRV
ncbi:hypothetical protein C9I36_02075 [Pectobacterium punjabense]|uniref:hypothetical protein n=1 Tax=Pectobacterium punjabense TaxID=2108399 RepID=UPI000D1697DA|nr:hypothetical protein [Pectobacterium punjabense]PTA65958.1 hypothetical protein C9I36_02075 [Pectobacterium punjabense]